MRLEHESRQFSRESKTFQLQMVWGLSQSEFVCATVVKCCGQMLMNRRTPVMAAAQTTMPMRIAITIVMLVLGTGCGSSSQHPPSVPVSGDPWFGTAGNVLISEGTDRDGPKDFLWIGFNSQTEWQNFLSLNQNHTLGWIGGPVILTSNNSMGFFFDPSQTIAAETTAEGLQTSLDQIEANPSKFVPGLISRWYVPAIVEQVRR
jgi:hypothetical protein